MLTHYTEIPLISIVIPTRNRNLCVETLVEDLVSDQYYQLENVEILIFDNASTCTSYRIPSNIPIHTHQENINFAGNYAFSILQSRGQYIWVMGDDDALRDDTLQLVIELIKLRNPKLIRLRRDPIHTDDVLRKYSIDSKNPLVDQFCFYQFSSKNLRRFEDGSGIITAHIHERNNLISALKSARLNMSSFFYSSNPYINKYCDIISLIEAGGFWESVQPLFRHRIPFTGRNCTNSSQEYFETFVLAPAEIYCLVSRLYPYLGNELLEIQLSRPISFSSYAKGGMPISIAVKYISRFMRYMSAMQLASILAKLVYGYLVVLREMLRFAK